MNKLRNGFTLVELIVAIGVLAIFVVVATLTLQSVQRNARRSNRRLAATKLSDNINIFNVEAIMAGTNQIDEDTFVLLGSDFPEAMNGDIETGPGAYSAVGIREIGDGDRFAIVFVNGAGASHAIIFNTLAEVNIVLGKSANVENAAGSTASSGANLSNALVQIHNDSILGTIVMLNEANILTTP